MILVKVSLGLERIWGSEQQREANSIQENT